MGDCNEHAVLLAALARATGIPVKIEAGLVYLNGRFYYHAWNLLYLGKWVTADALFGQIPADVTHIRFASGQQKQQLDLMSIIGKIRLKIISQTL
ncbi:MAG: lasso peptide biosynthesis protein [Desulfobacteraceae bacterium]|nr:lasso peptide biosynthesis protein [Desulfobacteraceae bacterium]